MPKLFWHPSSRHPTRSQLRSSDILSVQFHHFRRHTSLEHRGGSICWGRGGARAPRFTCCPQIQKLADCSDVISEVPKCSKIQIFWVSAPDPEAYSALAPQTADSSDSQEPHPRSWAFGHRFYGSQGLTHYRVGNATNERSDFKYRPVWSSYFSVSENGENRLGDEGADGGNPPARNFGLEPPLDITGSLRRYAYTVYTNSITHYSRIDYRSEPYDTIECKKSLGTDCWKLQRQFFSAKTFRVWKVMIRAVRYNSSYAGRIAAICPIKKIDLDRCVATCGVDLSPIDRILRRPDRVTLYQVQLALSVYGKTLWTYRVTYNALHSCTRTTTTQQQILFARKKHINTI